MTKEDAIKLIRKYECNKEHYEACEMAIKALEVADLDGYSSRLWKAAYGRGKADAEHESALDKIIAEIREWYWQADKQALAKDPCVVDAMIDLFIRTINKHKAESEDGE